MTTTTPTRQRPCPPWIDPDVWPLIPGWRQIVEVQKWWAELGISEPEGRTMAADLLRAAVQHADRGMTVGDLAGSIGIRAESIRGRLREMPGGAAVLARLDGNRQAAHRTRYRKLRAEGVPFADMPADVQRFMRSFWHAQRVAA